MLNKWMENAGENTGKCANENIQIKTVLLKGDDLIREIL